jgi:hypothetical protein
MIIWSFVMTTIICKVAVVSLLLGLTTVNIFSCKKRTAGAKASDAEVSDNVWDDDSFTVHVTSLAEESEAVWILTELRAFSKPDSTLSPREPGYVLRVFEKQPERRKERGIFIYSGTYAVQPTPENMRFMSTLDLKLYNQPLWRKSEAALIEALQKECQERNIPLYVNQSLNLEGEWIMLAPTRANPK